MNIFSRYAASFRRYGNSAFELGIRAGRMHAEYGNTHLELCALGAIGLCSLFSDEDTVKLRMNGNESFPLSERVLWYKPFEPALDLAGLTSRRMEKVIHQYLTDPVNQEPLPLNPIDGPEDDVAPELLEPAVPEEPATPLPLNPLDSPGDVAKRFIQEPFKELKDSHDEYLLAYDKLETITTREKFRELLNEYNRKKRGLEDKMKTVDDLLKKPHVQQYMATDKEFLTEEKSLLEKARSDLESKNPKFFQNNIERNKKFEEIGKLQTDISLLLQREIGSETIEQWRGQLNALIACIKEIDEMEEKNLGLLKPGHFLSLEEARRLKARMNREITVYDQKRIFADLQKNHEAFKADLEVLNPLVIKGEKDPGFQKARERTQNSANMLKQSVIEADPVVNNPFEKELVEERQKLLSAARIDCQKFNAFRVHLYQKNRGWFGFFIPASWSRKKMTEEGMKKVGAVPVAQFAEKSVRQISETSRENDSRNDAIKEVATWTFFGCTAIIISAAAYVLQRE